MRIAIIITNPNHHVELTLPVVLELKNQGHEPYYVSFCELRRMKTPTQQFGNHKLDYVRFKELPASVKPSSGVKTLGNSHSALRVGIQEIFWWLRLRAFFVREISKAEKVLLMNDFAYPGNRFVKYLRNVSIPFYLLQEGIRFPLPQERESGYGSNGANKIFSWGIKSAEHFRQIKKDTTKVVISGSPRIDDQFKYFREFVNQPSDTKVIGLFTNPIDDQGFCSFDQKISIVEKFFQRFGRTINEHGMRVIIKTHPRENGQDYLRIAKEYISDCTVLSGNIKDAINKVDVGVIMASTVGLELLMAKKAVIQLAIPGHGYVFDYVKEGAATPDKGLSEDKFLAMVSSEPTTKDAYLTEHFANLGESTEVIINELLND